MNNEQVKSWILGYLEACKDTGLTKEQITTIIDKSKEVVSVNYYSPTNIRDTIKLKDWRIPCPI